MSSASLHSSPFSRATLTLTVPLPPAYLGSELQGVRCALSELLVKFCPALGGVLLAHGQPRLASSGQYVSSHGGGLALGRIYEELPLVHVRASAEALLFRPELGQVLHGRVASVSSGHVGLLVAGLFNATVHADDMASGYAYDEEARAWVACAAHAAAVAAAAAGGQATGSEAGGKRKRTKQGGAAAAAAAAPHNRLLAFNPRVVKPGTHAAFRLTRFAFSNGLFQMWGSFEDGGGAQAAAPLPLPPAPGADGGWDDAGSVISAYMPPALELGAAPGEEAAAGGEAEAEVEAPKQKKKKRVEG